MIKILINCGAVHNFHVCLVKSRVLLTILLIIFYCGFGQDMRDTVKVRQLMDKIKKGKFAEKYTDSLRIYASEGLAIAEKIGDRKGQARLHLELGIYHWVTRDYTQTISHYKQAGEFYRQLEDREGEAMTDSNLGSVFKALGDYERALEYFQKSMKVFKALENKKRIAISTVNLGLVYMSFKDYTTAIGLLREAVHLDSSMAASSFTNLGVAYFLTGKTDSAIFYYQKGLELDESSNNWWGAAILLNNLGEAKLVMGDYEGALQNINKGLSIALEHKFPGSQVTALLNLGQVNIRLKNYSQAKAFLNEALILADKHKDIGRLEEVYKWLAACYREAGEYHRALTYTDKYVHLKDSVFTNEIATRLSNLRVIHEVEQKEATIKLLENEKAITELSRNMVIVVSLCTLLILGLLILMWRTRFVKAIRENELEKKNMQAELMIKTLSEDKLKTELDFKNLQLTSQALNIIQKTEIMDRIRTEIELIRISSSEEIQSKLSRLTANLKSSHRIDKDWENFKYYFEQVNGGFFDNLVASYPDLSPKDLKMCALLKLNFDTKQIASILDISADSAKMARHRIRKKLGLNGEENLVTFFNRMS